MHNTNINFLHVIILRRLDSKKNYLLDVPYNFKNDLFSNKLSFGNEKNPIAYLLDYFAASLYRAVHLEEIKII